MKPVVLSLLLLAPTLAVGWGLRSARDIGDAGGDVDAGTRQALQRVEAVEDLRTSRVLCRLTGSEGQDLATVRLQPADNARSLVFNNDATGVETRVQCEGAPDPECLSGHAPDTAASIDECVKCPCAGNRGKTYGAYASATAAEVEKRCFKGGDGGFRTLLLGLGAGELATHLAKSCGDTAVLEGVELDGRLPALARTYFGLPDSIKVTVGDAGSVAATLRQGADEDKLTGDEKRYDVVMVDCFSTGGVTPEACRSSEFIDNIHAIVRGGGSVMHHLWHNDDKHPEVADEFEQTVALYKQKFACKGCTVEVRALEGPDSLVIASVGGSASTASA